MEHIDTILYINLDIRPDRKEHFLNELPKLCTDMTKVHRIAGVYDPNGTIGCGKSHILAVETFLANPDWNTCIIFEDDFTFHNQDISYNNQVLRDIMTNFIDWDCIMLGISKWNKKILNTHIDTIKRVMEGQTTSGYLITRKFAHILLETLKEGQDKLIETNNIALYANDQSWKKLQPLHNWYIPVPSLGYQYGNYSNILQKNMDYGC
jgi:GR25 family glycosyltransferase involved in LPS biosynthesis